MMNKISVLLVSISLTIYICITAQPQYGIKFYMIGSSDCGVCNHTHEVLKQLYGEENIVFYDIEVNKSFLLNLKNISRIVEQPLWIPYTAIFINDRLIVIAIGYGDISFWESIPNKTVNENTVYVYNLYISTKNPVKTISNITEINRLYKLFNYTFQRDENRDEIKDVLPIIIMSAAADSINPCTFSVFTALLLITISLVGLKKMFKVGLAFIIAVFISYTLMGVGLIYVLKSIPYVKMIIGVAAIIVGCHLLYTNIFVKYKTLEPRFLKKKIESIIEKAINPLGSFIAGIFISFTLLPCTSGPYFVAMAVISSLSYLNAIVLLLTYNLIFISPLVLIFLGIYYSIIGIKGIKKFRVKNVKYLNIVEALLLILIGIYVLLIS